MLPSTDCPDAKGVTAEIASRAAAASFPLEVLYVKESFVRREASRHRLA